MPIAAAILAGCDRSSGSAGIDGTGAPIVAQNTLAYGSVSALGSVWVNEVRYDTSTAAIVIDGRAATEADIETGDIVLVSAKPDPQNSTRLVAVRVTVDDAVEGPISEIDLAISSLVVLGQTVRVAPTTLFDDNVSTASLAALALGDVVEVAGFRGSNGDVIATRIEAKPSGGEFETTGVVADLDVTARRFTIGALTVEYGTAAPSPTSAIRAGDIVEAKGSVLLPGGTLVASSVEPTAAVSGGAGDRVDMEGYVTSVHPQTARSFNVAGVPARITNDTILTDVNVVLDAKIGVKGSLDSAGTVVASNVVPVVRSGPTPPAGAYSVVGQVFEASSGMVAANTPVNFWIQTPSFGYSYWWAYGALYTNGRGEFTTVNFLPASDIIVHAGHGPWVQPCAVTARLPGAANLQIEVLRASAFDDALNGPRPQLLRGPSLTGTVFETVNGARQPVAGALIWAYTNFDLDLASTKTDLQGRFFFCNLSEPVALVTGKDGFEWNYEYPVDPAASDVEIELIRE